ncbi:MAG: ion transporter [Verrucomicrobiota bacterium]
MKERLNRFLKSSGFQNIIIGVIVFAGVLVGLSTFESVMEKHGALIEVLDTIVLWIFTIEILLKLIGLWPKPQRFFCDGWNVFDFVIVAVCFLPFGGSYVAVLRLFRLLRVLRLVTVIPRLQLLVGAMLKSLPSMGYVTILLFLLFYIYAVMGVLLFGKNDPVHFGDLWTSLLSLFRVVTLEDWTDVMYIQMFGSDVYEGYNQPVGVTPEPKAMPIVGAAYFVSFVLLGTMVMLNLVIGVIINGMDEAQKEIADRALHEALAHEDEAISSAAAREKEILELKKKLEEITEALGKLK